ncbi:unnamed protein product, partial [Porites lobata]
GENGGKARNCRVLRRVLARSPGSSSWLDFLSFNFQPSDQTILYRHSSRLDHETVHQTTTTDSQIRRPHPNTTKDNRHDPTTKSDHQIPSPPPIQTTRSDHPTRPQDTI